MITLGIESSCDDTAVAIVDGSKILAEKIWTQTEEHACYGGVVPEIASRAHLQKSSALVSAVLEESGLAIGDVELFAAGAGPGLIGGLIVGLNLAKAMAFALNKPFVAVNHLEAHALVPTMFSSVAYPYLLFLASGGHTQILRVSAVGSYELLGTTIDDALGECFDKTAKLLGFNYMGGREIEKLAVLGNPKAFDFPRPLMNSGDFNFSFSGLKTAVRLAVERSPDASAADVAASVQASVCEVIYRKISAVLAVSDGLTAVVASGGVASNQAIRNVLEKCAAKRGLPFFVAPPKYCTDNGVMIAHAGELEFERRGTSPLDITPRPRWPLEEIDD